MCRLAMSWIKHGWSLVSKVVLTSFSFYLIASEVTASCMCVCTSAEYLKVLLIGKHDVLKRFIFFFSNDLYIDFFVHSLLLKLPDYSAWFYCMMLVHVECIVQHSFIEYLEFYHNQLSWCIIAGLIGNHSAWN